MARFNVGDEVWTNDEKSTSVHLRGTIVGYDPDEEEVTIEVTDYTFQGYGPYKILTEVVTRHETEVFYGES